MATVCISIPDKMFEALEDKRGGRKRSQQYQKILKKDLGDVKL